MSGVFMDGGSQVFMDGGSSVFMDGGSDGGHQGHYQHGDGGFAGDGGFLVDGHTADGAQGNHNGHAVHAGDGGGDGGFLSNLISGDSKHHHGFLSHLLGLDHDGGGHSHANHGATGHATSQTAIWTSALQGMKLSHFVQGINFSANFGLLMLFVGFTVWLYVIYLVRHNEPFTNQVLGTVPINDSVASDRRLVNRLSSAMPIRIQPGGEVYEPLPSAEPSATGSLRSASAVEQSAVSTNISASESNMTPATTVNPNQPFGLPAGVGTESADTTAAPADSTSAMQTYSFIPSAQAQNSVPSAVPSAYPQSTDFGSPTTGSSQPQFNNMPPVQSMPIATGSRSSVSVSAVPSRFGNKVKFFVNN